jgi:hypothetical protein
LALGCGDDGKSEATQKCEDFASTWCNKAIGCLKEIGNTITEANFSESLDTCTRTGIAAANCGRAVSVGSGYDACISGVNAMPCSTWNVPESELSTVRPPNSCVGVIGEK